MELETMYPGLGPRDALAYDGGEVALVLLRDNTPGYANWFAKGQLNMEAREAARSDNARLTDTKVR
jgi:hypothetical protein